MLTVKQLSSGFTLIESLLYVALFAVIIGGGMVGAYQIIESTNNLNSKTVIEQEGEFIVKKINWAITGANSLTVNGAGNELTAGAAVFSLLDGNFLKNGTALNNSFVKISNLLFMPLSGVTDGVAVTFTVSSLDGRASRDFKMEKYAKF